MYAGFRSPVADYTADFLVLNQYLADCVGYTSLFDVVGWSMSGAHIVEGNEVMADRSTYSTCTVDTLRTQGTNCGAVNVFVESGRFKPGESQ